jgi:uncharacterized protein YlxP (DUF503 family)
MKMSRESIHIVLVTVELHIPFAHSLKDKRSIVRGLKESLRARFNASVSEFGYQDKWQRALIGVCMISGNRQKLVKDLAQVDELCRELHNVEIVNIDINWL